MTDLVPYVSRALGGLASAFAALDDAYVQTAQGTMDSPTLT